MTGRFNGQFKTYAICGAIRRMVSPRAGLSRGRRAGVAFSSLLSGLSPFVGGRDVSLTGFCRLLALPGGRTGVLEGPKQDPSETVCCAFVTLHLVGQA